MDATGKMDHKALLLQENRSVRAPTIRIHRIGGCPCDGSEKMPQARNRSQLRRSYPEYCWSFRHVVASVHVDMLGGAGKKNMVHGLACLAKL